MHRRFRHWPAALAVLLLCAMSLPSIATAQEETPTPGQEASGLLPEASLFGDGWTAGETVSPDLVRRYSFTMSPDVFREGAARVYLGPDGARVVVITLLLTDNRVAVRKSWEDASDLMSGAASGVDEDYERRQALETMDPPAGCVEAKRLEGVEETYLLPFAMTMCAVDPDGILIAIASGEVLGQTGVAASDAIVVASLNGAFGTPQA